MLSKTHANLMKLIFYFLLKFNNEDSNQQFLELFFSHILIYFKIIFDPQYEIKQYLGAFCFKIWQVIKTHRNNITHIIFNNNTQKCFDILSLVMTNFHKIFKEFLVSNSNSEQQNLFNNGFVMYF